MIIKSPYPDVSIPSQDLTSFVFEHSSSFAEKPALIDSATGASISFSELHDRIGRVAAGFRAHGISHGDVVGILLPNSFEFPIAFHAAAMLGAAATTINPFWTGEEILRQLIDSKAKLLVTIERYVVPGCTLQRELEMPTLIVGGEGNDSFESLYEFDPIDKSVSFDPVGTIAALPYSSGTTGLSKGVMLTHRNLVANLCQMAITEEIGSGDVLLCVLPMFHIYGMVVILNLGLRTGATIVVMERFDLRAMLQAIEQYRISFAHLVPPILLAISNSAGDCGRDLSSLKTVMSAAAPLSQEIAVQCARTLGCRVKQGWGMTETSPAATMSEPKTADSLTSGVGKLVPNTEMKVVDLATGTELGIGEKGELLVRGPQVMLGYLNRPDATNDMLDSEGWLRTGDIGFANSEGEFFIVDRAKELIKYKGFQIPPAELEAILLSHPSVVDTAVVAFPDTEAGEVPKAWVVLRSEVSDDELMQHVACRVAKYKQLRFIETIDTIPRSASGKILRRELVARDRAI